MHRQSLAPHARVSVKVLASAPFTAEAMLFFRARLGEQRGVEAESPASVNAAAFLILTFAARSPGRLRVSTASMGPHAIVPRG